MVSHSLEDLTEKARCAIGERPERSGLLFFVAPVGCDPSQTTDQSVGQTEPYRHHLKPPD